MEIVIMPELFMIRNAELIAASLLRDGEKIFILLICDAFALSSTKFMVELLFFRYHIPRSWLTPTGNLLVVFEEWGGDPTWMSLVERVRV